MKNVTIVFPIRDAGAYLCQLKTQIDCIDYPAQNIKIIAVEGDSIDGTPALLATWAAGDRRVKIITHNTGNPKFGQVINPERMAHLANVFNTGLNAVDCTWSNYVLFTPSDIIWHTDIIKRLIDNDKKFIAPMYWTNENGHSRFYDTWGFSQGGANFRPLPKAWYQMNFPGGPVALDTVGGMVLIDAALIAAGARYSPLDCDHGLCRAAQKLGATIYADTSTHIYHR